MSLFVGLDIGTSAVRAALLQGGKKGTPVLKKYGEVALPPGAVDGGEILDADVVREAIIQLWKRAKLPKRNIVLGLANQRIIVRPVDVPALSDEALRESLAAHVADFIPMSVENAVLDFMPLGGAMTESQTVAAGDGDGPRELGVRPILVVAAQREMVDNLIGVVESAGLKILALDLQAFALVRAVYGARIPLGEPAEAIVSIGAGLTQVVITRDGEAVFFRLVPFGGNEFTEALMTGLDIERGCGRGAEAPGRRPGRGWRGRPPRIRGRPGTGDPHSHRQPTHRRDSRLPRVLREHPGRRCPGAGDEDLGQRCPPTTPRGPSRPLPRTAADTGEAAGRVGRGRQDRAHRGSARPGPAGAPGGSRARGVGARLMPKINLLPQERAESAARRRGVAMALFLALVYIAALALVFFMVKGRETTAEDDLATQLQANQLLQAEIAELEPYEQLRREYEAGVMQLQQALALDVAWGRVLGDFGRMIPQGVWLEALTIQTMAPVVPEGEEADPSRPCSLRRGHDVRQGLRGGQRGDVAGHPRLPGLGGRGCRLGLDRDQEPGDQRR